MSSQNHDQMTDEQGRNWYTVRFAADQLGVSANTLRRRIKRGEMTSTIEELPYGPTVYVAADEINQASAALVVVKAKRTESAQELAFAVAELMRQENKGIAERLEGLQATVDELGSKIDALTQNANKSHFRLPRWPWSKQKK